MDPVFYLENMRDQDQAGLKAVFEPSSIAVIGASRHENTIGYQILDNLIRNRYSGAVYPVNPNADVIHSMRAYASIGEIPDPVDLAVIVVPKEYVLQVAGECGEAGVRGLVVISAGFREVGGEGTEREEELAALVRNHGMRMVGPNCMGVLNTQPDLRMNATFAPTTPPEGGVALLSQSGAMGVTILDYAREYGIGISKFVSMGNKADISGNDVLEYLREDQYTSVILMYLENFGNPSRFMRIARQLTKEKPVIAVKAARTRAAIPALSPAATSPPMRSSPRWGSCGSTPFRSSSTSRWVSATPRCPAATGWPSSPTPEVQGSSSPTPVSRRVCRSRAWPRRRRSSCVLRCPPRRR